VEKTPPDDVQNGIDSRGMSPEAGDRDSMIKITIVRQNLALMITLPGFPYTI